MPTNSALYDPTKDPNDPYYGNSNGTQSDQIKFEPPAPYTRAGGWSQTPLVNSAGVQVAGNPQANYPQAYYPTTPAPPPTTQQVYNSWADYFQQQGNQSIAQNVSPYQTALDQGLPQDAATRAALLQGQAGALTSATNSNAAMLQGMDQSRQNIDASSSQLLGNYWGQLGQANNLMTGSLAQLQGLNGQMRQLQAGGYGADVTSDPTYVGMQLGAYNNLGNWASGANNISSDAGLVGQQQGVANAFGGWAAGQNDISSDPGLVSQQQGVFGAYGDWASGMNDVSSDAALVGQQQNVLNGYGDWASGANDLTSEAAGATADAQALAAQKEALGAYRERIDPRLTDAERYLYLQNRMQQEQTMRGVRDANMRELQRQGMSGSTMALSNLNSSSQEAANMRQLGDLGANAAAINRAQQSLAGYAGLSSTIADQSFNRDFSVRTAADRMAVQNNQQRFAGLQGEGQMATVMRNADDNLRQGNQQMRFAGLQGQGTQANTMRSQDDAIRSQNQGMRMQGLQGQGGMVNSMRTADDAMRTGNANRMLQGGIAQGDMANSIRTADDAMKTFNKSQSMIQQRFQDQFASDQQQQAWNRGTDLTNAGMRASEGLARNATTGWEAGDRTLSGQWDRYTTQTQTGMQANRDYMTGVGDLTRGGLQATRDNRDGLAQSANFAMGTEGLRQGIASSSNAVRMQGVDQQMEDKRASDAIAAAQAEANRQAKEAKKKQILNVVGQTTMPFIFKGV